MAIDFQGEFRVARDREHVYEFLSDPEKFAPSLPDLQGFEMQDDKNFTLKLRVGVSQIRGAATVKLHLAEENPPTHAHYEGKGRMAAGSVNLQASFDLEEDSGGTLVKWRGEARIFGTIKSLAGGLLKPLARKNIEKFVGSLQAAMDET